LRPTGAVGVGDETVNYLAAIGPAIGMQSSFGLDANDDRSYGTEVVAAPRPTIRQTPPSICVADAEGVRGAT
jgi:hypothetical protein